MHIEALGKKSRPSIPGSLNATYLDWALMDTTVDEALDVVFELPFLNLCSGVW